MGLTREEDEAVTEYWGKRLWEYSEQADSLRDEIADAARVQVADVSQALSDSVNATNEAYAARLAEEEAHKLASHDAVMGQRRVQMRKQRAANVREEQYAAGEAGAASYWRDPVGRHRDGNCSNDVMFCCNSDVVCSMALAFVLIPAHPDHLQANWGVMWINSRIPTFWHEKRGLRTTPVGRGSETTQRRWWSRVSLTCSGWLSWRRSITITS